MDIKKMIQGVIDQKSQGMDTEKRIETDNLRIQGNIMCWGGKMVQLSNVSYLSTRRIVPEEFPKPTILIGIVSLFFLKSMIAVTLILWIAVGIWVYSWHKKKVVDEATRCLSIRTNSGDTFYILIMDEMFLNTILNVLEKIISDGGVGNQQVLINIQDSTITGNARVLEDLKIIS